MDIPDEYVDFAVKYKDWVAIKRLRVLPDTKPEEVAFHLAGISSTIDSKAYNLLGINTNSLDSYASNSTSNLKKGVMAVGEVLSRINSAEAKKAIEDSCTNKAVVPLARTYLMNRLIGSMNVQTNITQEAMSKIFTDLKAPKFPGRAKGKK